MLGLSDGRSWVCPSGKPNYGLAEGACGTLDRGPAAPYFPSHLTYPSIKRYTHGNCKGMKSRHPAYSKLCGSCSYYFFLFLLESPIGINWRGSTPSPPKKKNPNKILKYNMPFFSQKGAFSGPSKSLNIPISGALILQKYLPRFQGP